MLILIAGYCATGKSTFASTLSYELRVPFFDKDTFKERVGDAIGSDERGVIGKLSSVAFELLKLTAERFLSVGQSVILESNFTPANIAEMNALIRRCNSDAMTFLFTGDLRVLFERYQNRRRHWVHRDSDELRDEFVSGNIPLGQIEPLGELVRIDATDFASVDYGKLVELAASKMRGGA